MLIRILNSRQIPAIDCRFEKTELVAALNLEKRRDIKGLIGFERLAIMNCSVVARIQNINMPLPKRVIDLSNDGPKASVLALAEPEADRLKGIAKHARKGLQPDLAIGIMNAGLLE